MEATTAKAVPAAPATSRPPEPKGPPRPKATYAYRDIPGWFVRLQGKGGSTTQRRGPNQNCGYRVSQILEGLRRIEGARKPRRDEDGGLAHCCF